MEFLADACLPGWPQARKNFEQPKKVSAGSIFIPATVVLHTRRVCHLSCSSFVTSVAFTAPLGWLHDLRVGKGRPGPSFFRFDPEHFQQRCRCRIMNVAIDL
jgi:hypothetical protein